VMALSLVLTLSRSGTTCFLLALMISGWFVVRRQAAGSRRRVSVFYVVAVAIVSLGWVGLDVILARFAQASLDFSTRYDIWKDAWTIFQAFPWLGTGLNTFGAAMTFYQTSQLDVHTVEAHNDYVQLLSEGGLALAIVGILGMILLGREVRRRFREDADDQTTYWIRVGATTGLVAIAFQELAEFSLQMPGNAALFAIVSAIAIWPAREGDPSS
jgi:O-antigen ligase